MLELAVQTFVEQMRSHPNGSEAFIAEQKKKFKVPSTAAREEVLIARTPRLHLIQGVVAVEHFVKAFRREYSAISGKKWTSEAKQTLSPLEQLRANLACGPILADTSEFALVEYYRNCRNVDVHRLDAEEVSRDHERLMTRFRADIAARFRRIPRPISQLYHGDYVLLGRALLALAQRVNTECPLTPQGAVQLTQRDTEWVRDLMRSRGYEPSLLRKARRGAVQRFWASAEAADEVAQLLARYVRTLPNARQRRRQAASSGR